MVDHLVQNSCIIHESIFFQSEKTNFTPAISKISIFIIVKNTSKSVFSNSSGLFQLATNLVMQIALPYFAVKNNYIILPILFKILEIELSLKINSTLIFLKQPFSCPKNTKKLMSVAKQKALSEASRQKLKIEIHVLTRSFASRFLLRFAQPFLARVNWTSNWSLYPQWLSCTLGCFSKNDTKRQFQPSINRFKLAFFLFALRRNCESHNIFE